MADPASTIQPLGVDPSMADASPSIQMTLHLMAMEQERHQEALAQANLVTQTKSKQLEDVTSALHSQIEALQFGQESLSQVAAGERLVDSALTHSVNRQRKEKEETREFFHGSADRLQKSLGEHKATLAALVKDAQLISTQAEEKSSSFTSTIGPLLLSDHEQKATLMRERVREKSVAELSAELLHAFSEGFASSSTGASSRGILSGSRADAGAYQQPLGADGQELTLVAQLAKEVAEESEEARAVTEDLKSDLHDELDVLLKRHAASSRWMEKSTTPATTPGHEVPGLPGLVPSPPAGAVAKHHYQAEEDPGMKRLREQQLAQAESLNSQNRRTAESLQHEKIRQLRAQIDAQNKVDQESPVPVALRSATSSCSPEGAHVEEPPLHAPPEMVVPPTYSSPQHGIKVGMASPFGTVDHPRMTLDQRDRYDQKEVVGAGAAGDMSSELDDAGSTLAENHHQNKSTIKKATPLRAPSAALMRAMYRELPHHASNIQEVPRDQVTALNLGLRGEVKPVPNALSTPRGLGGLKAAPRTRTPPTTFDRKRTKNNELLSRNVRGHVSSSGAMGGAGGAYAQEELNALREHRRWR